MKPLILILPILLLLSGIFITADRLIFLHYKTDHNCGVNISEIQPIIDSAVSRGQSPCEVIPKSWGVHIRCGGVPFYEEYKIEGRIYEN